jgi:ABC-type transporter MlaC component
VGAGAGQHHRPVQPAARHEGRRRDADVPAGRERPQPAAIVAAIQHALYLAGDYYPSTYTPVSGLIRPTDAQAFAKFLTETAQTNSGLSDEAKKPLTTALVDASAMGAMAGTAQVKQVARRAGNVVTVPSATDLAAVAQGEARKVLGRNASDAQVKAFVNYYQNVTKDYQQQLDQAQYSAQYDAAQPAHPEGEGRTAPPTSTATASRCPLPTSRLLRGRGSPRWTRAGSPPTGSWTTPTASTTSPPPAAVPDGLHGAGRGHRERRELLLRGGRRSARPEAGAAVTVRGQPGP